MPAQINLVFTTTTNQITTNQWIETLLQFSGGKDHAIDCFFYFLSLKPELCNLRQQQHPQPGQQRQNEKIHITTTVTTAAKNTTTTSSSRPLVEEQEEKDNNNMKQIMPKAKRQKTYDF